MSCPNWIYATAGTCGVGGRRVFHYASQLKSGSINIQYQGKLNKISPGSDFILGGISDSSNRSPEEEFNLRSLDETTLGTAADGREEGNGESLDLTAGQLCNLATHAGILGLHSW